jgi:hypothetical protein
MVWGGTVEKIQARNGGIIIWTGFDADGEIGTAVDVIRGHEYGIVPTNWSWQLERTSGSTGTVAVKLEASIDNVTFITLATATAHNQTVHQQADFTGTDNVRELYRYFRVTVTTVGSGNTLNVHLLVAE